MSVREAVEADVPRVLEIARAFHAASVMVRIPLNEAKVASVLRECISNPMMGAWVWTPDGPESDGTVRGVYAGRVDAWFFSDEKVAVDIGVFIDPAHRGSGGAGELFETFKAWARERGAKTVFPGISSGVAIERAAHFYEAHGMVKVGYIFWGDLTRDA